MKRVKCKFTYESVLVLSDKEYEEIKEQVDIREVEKAIKGHLDNILLEGRRDESSKITSFYLGADKEWQ